MTTWAEVLGAVEVALSGDRERGRALLSECWATTTDDDHAHRCVIAHYLADLQTHVDDEVAWDERALAAYGSVAGSDLAPVGILDARGMAPSLHLNLGDGYLRQGRLTEARRHVRAGLADVDALGADGYADLIRSGLTRLDERIRAQEA